jgi:hypothetical protein
MGAIEVPVSVVRLSEVREKALNVVLNNQEAQGRYDPVRLAELLNDLEDLPELEMTGFDADTLPRLQLDPPPRLPPPEDTGWITVTLEMERETFDRLQGRLDALVAEFDLTSHVRRG